MKKLNLCFIIEDTTDIRLIDGLNKYFNVTIFGRRRKNYNIVPWKIPEDVNTFLFSCRRILYPVVLFFSLLRNSSSFDFFVVNSDTLTALSVNLVKYFVRKPSISVIQKPTLEYLQAKNLKGNVKLVHYQLLHVIARILVMWNIAHFDLNIVVSNYIKCKLLKYSKNKIVVIPFYGIDTLFAPSYKKTKNQIRKELSLPQDKYIIFVSSRISPEKDITTLFKSVKLLIADGINDIILLNLSGQCEDFIRIAKGFGLDKFAIGRPAIIPYALPPYYQAIDLCVQPSLFEGLGLSPLESLACGTPAIVSHTGGLKESTSHKVHSLHFKPNGPEDLADKIKYAYKNRKELLSMAQRARIRIREKYNSADVFRAFKMTVEKLGYYKTLKDIQIVHGASFARTVEFPKGIRIAMIVNLLPDLAHHGGVSYQVHGLAQELSKKFKITVIAMNKTNLVHNYKTIEIQFPEFLNRSKFFKILLFPLFVRFKGLNKFDIIHAHGDDYVLFCLKRPIIRTFYGSALGEMLSASSFQRKIHQMFRYFTEFLSGFHAKINVSISHSTRKYLPFINRVIPCSIDLDKFIPGEEKSENPSILFVGTIKGRKRGWFLVKTFVEEVKPKIPDAELWVVSSEEIEGDGVTWFGRVSENKLIELYQKAWVFCLPSIYEGFGVPYIEAMACGTSVVSSPNSGAREVLEDGRYGVITSDEHLGSNIIHLLKSKQIRDAYASKAISKAKQFSWDKVIKAYEALYKTLLEKSTL